MKTHDKHISSSGLSFGQMPVKENVFADRDALLANPNYLTCSEKKSLCSSNKVFVKNALLNY